MLFVKRVGLDEESAIGFLNSRVKTPAQQDQMKLIKTIGNLTQTIKDILTLEGECSGNLH